MKALVRCWMVLALCGCATNPASILPTPVDYKQFMIYDCPSLTDKVAATDYQLRRYMHSQSNARVADAIVWPVPLTRMLGKNSRNVEAIRRLGGELEALKKAQTLKCTAIEPATP
jgi:hypothetical protein